MDRRHVRRHARLPDRRGLSGPAGQEHRRAHHEADRHPGRLSLLRHDGHVARPAALRRRSVAVRRRGAGLRTLDLLPADHRCGPRHQDVGAGLRPADDGRGVDDPARRQMVRRGGHGARHVARNRSQPPPDHLLFPGGDGDLLDQRGHRRPARKASARLRRAHGRARRSGPAGRRLELRPAPVHGPAHERHDARRLGAGPGGGQCRQRTGHRLRDGLELRPGRELQPADPRLHGPRIGLDLPGRRSHRRRAERLRPARRRRAAADLLGRPALHRRPDLPRSRGDLPRGARHRAGPRPQQVVDRRSESADAAPGLGPQPDGIHPLRLRLPARLRQVPHRLDDARRRAVGRAGTRSPRPDSSVARRDSARTAPARLGVERRRHGRPLPAVRRGRRRPLRLRSAGEHRDDDRSVHPDLPRQRHAGLPRPRPRRRVGRSSRRGDGRRPGGDDGRRRLAVARHDPARSGRRGALRPAPTPS